MDFRISDREIDPSTHLVELGGEIDLYTAPEFKQRVAGAIESGKRQLVVDLSDATFIDSTTLGVLVGAEKQLRASDGAVVLVCPERNIRKVFEITGLDRVFTLHDSRDAALADAAGEPAG
jgi:anti-sigma B factor antagonist